MLFFFLGNELYNAPATRTCSKIYRKFVTAKTVTPSDYDEKFRQKAERGNDVATNQPSRLEEWRLAFVEGSSIRMNGVHDAPA